MHVWTTCNSRKFVVEGFFSVFSSLFWGLIFRCVPVLTMSSANMSNNIATFSTSAINVYISLGPLDGAIEGWHRMLYNMVRERYNDERTREKSGQIYA